MSGASEDYKALLRGEIEADEYVRRLKADVDARMSSTRRTRKRSSPGWFRLSTDEYIGRLERVAEAARRYAENPTRMRRDALRVALVVLDGASC